MEEQKGLVQEPKSTKERVVCCIGDVHGFITKIQNLWSNLESLIDPSDFETALIIFLGDYCDRGPDTRKVIDFLISLPSKYPKQSHVFLCGNHDLAFAAFVGVLPAPPDGVEFSETWKEYESSEDLEGWYKGDGYEKMHLQGRMWAGSMKVSFDPFKGTEFKGSIYDARPTFESYGVPHGSADLMKAVPDEHKKFLADLVWVHEENDKARGVEEQLKYLKARDTGVPKVEALSGRKNVWDIPKELTENPTIVLSGHHGKLHIEGLRLIIDEGGGLENNPVAAVVLPSRKIVRDTDVLSK
ncbi:hypothetical protein F0562_016807 [Nyssa sinensis]|uniref:Calcineurin-like phosphoesterase domain-containing protein n=1 Tax=Nyssa sinensis TaxID=561372 RepID=A0A5J4ZHH8_9ASTE|nr:hypothetical protein F0562_016807 [Nyssa sinensis]